MSLHLREYRRPRVVIEARREAVLQRPSDPSERFARNHIARLSPQVPFDLELEIVVDTRQELLETCELFLFESCILVKSVEESPDEQMLARRVCCRRNLGPGGGRSPRSDLSSEHLLSADPAGRLVDRVKPRREDLVCDVEIPQTYQVLMEALVPHEPASVVWCVGHCSEETGGSLFDDFSIFEDHPISMHVGHTAKHVPESILACVNLCLGPASC